jgi:hypothetical protein
MIAEELIPPTDTQEHVIRMDATSTLTDRVTPHSMAQE